MQDTFCEIIAADPRSLHDSDYFMSKRFPRDIEEAEWLHASVARLGAFLKHLHDDELPIAMKQAFADLRRDMQQVAPLNGEGPICASVRKMSLEEASACAGRIVTMYGEIARGGEGQASQPLTDNDETRVPPFLIKSV